MKLVTFGDRRLFVGNEAADALTRYAAVLSERGTADAVTLNVIGPDGRSTAATLVLSQGVTLIAETADETFVEPDNSDSVEYMKQRSEPARGRISTDGLTQQEVDEYRDFFGDL